MVGERVLAASKDLKITRDYVGSLKNLYCTVGSINARQVIIGSYELKLATLLKSTETREHVLS